MKAEDTDIPSEDRRWDGATTTQPAQKQQYNVDTEALRRFSRQNVLEGMFNIYQRFSV